MTVSPFTIAVPDAEIALLRERLRATRFPDVAPNTDFARGTSGEYLRELVAYWAGEFDWREAEAGLNAIPQFVAEVDGRPVHFLHRVAADARGAILLLHGWPDTPFRYRRVLDDLTARGFDCVVPSLPGFAFTGGHALSSAATADLFQRLMTETLGYDTFVVAGGDVGTVVGSQLARRHADRVTALHLTNAEYPTGASPTSPTRSGPTPSSSSTGGPPRAVTRPCSPRSRRSWARPSTTVRPASPPGCWA